MFAGLLKAGGQDVRLLEKNEKRALYLKKNGIKISGLADLKVKVNAAANPDDAGKSDLVIFTVKAYDLKEAATGIKKSSLGKSSFYIGLQNGLGNVEILNCIFGEERVLPAVTNLGSTLLSPGNCRYAGKGITYLGVGSIKKQVAAEKIKKIFNECGIETEIKQDIESLIWGKLTANVGINAITAICRIKNGEILENKETRKLMVLLVKEFCMVAEKLKIKFPFANGVKYAESVCKKTAGNISSMLQDAQKGKKTEIDFINGAIVKKAQTLGLAVPYNEAVTYLVKAIKTVDSLRTKKLKVKRQNFRKLIP